MLVKISEKVHEVNKTLLWKEPPGQHTQDGEE